MAAAIKLTNFIILVAFLEVLWGQSIKGVKRKALASLFIPHYFFTVTVI